MESASTASATEAAPEDAKLHERYQVVILAGGTGHKLRTFTETCPKALLPIANRPMIWYPMKMVEQYGFQEVIILTRTHMEADIRQALERQQQETADIGVRWEVVAYEDEDELMDTFEALAHLEGHIQKDFFVLSCDLVGDANLRALDGVHRQGGDESRNACSILLGKYVEEPPKGKAPPKPQSKGIKQLVKDNPALCSAVLQYLPSPPAASGVGFEEAPIARVLRITDLEGKNLSDPKTRVCDEGGIMLLNKLAMHTFGCQFLMGTFQDLHVYLFSKSVLSLVRMKEQDDDQDDDEEDDDDDDDLDAGGGGGARGAGEGPRQSPPVKAFVQDIISIKKQLVPFLVRRQHSIDAEQWSGVSDPRAAPPVTHNEHLDANSITLQDAATLKPRGAAEVRAYVQEIFPLDSSHPSRTASVCERVMTKAMYRTLNLKLIGKDNTGLPLWLKPSRADPDQKDTSISKEELRFRSDNLFAPDSFPLLDNPNFSENGIKATKTVFGRNVRVGCKVKVSESVIMDNVTIQDGCSLKGCIVGRGITINQGSVLKNYSAAEGEDIEPGEVWEDKDFNE
ncbi:unnamed protein product [Vitrella brassicaformis CCMP3155]|uniref:Translation initiation factor eIF2B subunit gamma n=2 Tax=Vitrella brassicaformis TaxID=1169539 RepID=A0A0G4GQT0_VITBC|nr:unnamed protein product [Vitrella brassicaformis CCMP3155]|mmetsp:Transcript_8757/g.25079  ORF Transcript_8757/g.25079 Transcript_8757/m.25079 type:complete len:568 (+) Transcript_8757:101-1804(+)|eukprot:CEM32826.1 unnamed protein product [Vitrella brassicaformis CCMP3155]